VDGKAVRGAADPDGLILYLLAAALHAHRVGDRRDPDRPEDERGPGTRAAAAEAERDATRPSAPMAAQPETKSMSFHRTASV